MREFLLYEPLFRFGLTYLPKHTQIVTPTNSPSRSLSSAGRSLGVSGCAQGLDIAVKSTDGYPSFDVRLSILFRNEPGALLSRSQPALQKAAPRRAL